MTKKIIVIGMLFVLAMMAWSCSSTTSPSDQTNVPAVEESSVPVVIDEDDSAPPISDENPTQETPPEPQVAAPAEKTQILLTYNRLSKNLFCQRLIVYYRSSPAL